VVLHSSTAQFSHRPYHFTMSVYFSTICYVTDQSATLATSPMPVAIKITRGDPELEWQIRCFPYGEHSDVLRLQQVEQKAVGQQRNLELHHTYRHSMCFRFIHFFWCFLSAETTMHCKVTCNLYKKQAHFSQLFCLQVRSVTPWQSHDRTSRCLRGRRHSSILYSPSGFFCVFVCHIFSYHPFYFDFHSARVIFDVSSGFYFWNVSRTPTKSNKACWSGTKQTSSSFHWKLTSSHHDIAENLLRWR
jgi:hypothetical protein